MPKHTKEQDISDIKKVGRPRVDSTLVAVRLPPDMLEALDKYAGTEKTRPAAIRTFLEVALLKKGLLPKR